MILALETSTTASSVAVFGAAGELLAERVDPKGPAHTQRLLPYVHEALGQAGVEAWELETIVCGLGPGAYTGMRIGVATARALAQATGARLGGVPTLAAVALALAEVAPEGVSLVPLLDGKRHEVFAACYGAEALRPPRQGTDRRDLRLGEISPLTVVPEDELAVWLEQWPGAAVGGDGAAIYADRLPPAAFSGAVAAPTAAMVGHAWLARVPGVREGFSEVLPIYGRDPDAAKWAGRSTT